MIYCFKLMFGYDLHMLECGFRVQIAVRLQGLCVFCSLCYINGRDLVNLT